MIANTDYVSSWKSTRLFAKNITPAAASDNSLAPALRYYRTKTRVKFTGSCLRQTKPSCTHSESIYIV